MGQANNPNGNDNGNGNALAVGSLRTRWTNAMVAQLVHLRLTELRAQFQAARQHPQLLAVAWAALRLRLREWLRAQGQPPLNVVQLKNKWFALRKEFHEVRGKEATARNALQAGRQAAAVEYPSYWGVLAASFGDDDDVQSPTARAVAALASESAARVRRKASTSRRIESERSTRAAERESKAPRMKWTQPMVALLLELRLVTFRDAFRGSVSSARLRDVWLELRESFVSQSSGSAPDVLQLKNKFGALRKEFVAVTRVKRAFAKQQQQQPSGGETKVTPPEVPTYWPVLEKYCTGRVEVPDEDQASESEATGEDDRQETEEAAAAADGLQPTAPADAASQPSTLPADTAVDISSFTRVGRMRWDGATTATLLGLRAREMKDAFSGERGPAQLKMLWEELRIKFALAHKLLVDVNQLKNKYNALRREFAAISEQLQAAKNADGEQRTVELPPYWDALTLAFGSSASAVGFNAPAADTAATTAGRASLSRKRRRPSGPTVNGELDGETSGERDPMRRLVELLELQAKRQEEIRALLQRQVQELDVMAAQTSVVNRAVLEFLRVASRSDSSVTDNGGGIVSEQG